MRLGKMGESLLSRSHITSNTYDDTALSGYDIASRWRVQWLIELRDAYNPNVFMSFLSALLWPKTQVAS